MFKTPVIKIAIWLWLGIALLSCKTKQPRILYAPSTVHKLDSVVVHRLRPVPLPADTARVNALLECNSRGKIYAKLLQIEASKNVRLRFAIDSLGHLLFDARTSPDTVFVPSDSVYISKEVQKTEFVEVPAKLTPWERIKLKTGGWMIGGVSGVLLWGLFRLFRRITKGRFFIL